MLLVIEKFIGFDQEMSQPMFLDLSMSFEEFGMDVCLEKNPCRNGEQSETRNNINIHQFRSRDTGRVQRKVGRKHKKLRGE